MLEEEKRNTASERETKQKVVAKFWRAEEKREENVLLPKPERLSNSSDIKATLKVKQYTSSTPLLSLVARDNKQLFSRLVVVTPKKLGNACKRNRIRRVYYAAYGKIRHKIAKNIDLVVFPRIGEQVFTMDLSKEALCRCLCKANLINNA